MVYNLTTIQNSSNVMEMAQATNVILGGFFFGYFVLLMVGFITFVTLKAKGYLAPACFAVACWLTMLVALFLRPMSLLDNFSFWATILLSAISAFVLYLSGTTD